MFDWNKDDTPKAGGGSGAHKAIIKDQIQKQESPERFIEF